MPVIYKVTPIFPPKKDKFLEEKGFYLYNFLADALENDVGPMLEEEMDRRMAGWEHKVKTESKLMRQQRQLRLDSKPTGQNVRLWTFVSRGTRGKMIYPVNAPSLKIKGGYNAHTEAGDWYGGPGTYAGPFRRAMQADWPGIEARHFEEEILKNKRAKIQSLIAYAVTRALAK